MKENPYMDDKYNRGGDFLDNMASDSYIEFSCRWFGLANYSEMLDDIDEYFGYELGRYRDITNNPNCPIIPTTSSIIEPIRFYEASDTPIKISIPENISYESIVRNGGI